jgi:hypothetical protein
MKSPRRPRFRDWTDGLTVNADLTRGIWHNSFPGLKLSGALVFPPIAVPLWLMGIPVPKSDNETLQDEALQVVLDHVDDCKMIHLTSHRDATAWVFPFFSAELKREMWELIPDETICDIIRNLTTGEIVKVITDEEIIITTGYDATATIRRRRVFTREEVRVEWLAGVQVVPESLKDATFRNTLGIMPIPFANNRDGGDVRGHSDLERILSDLKNYHDVDLALSEHLVKFAPKMVQYTKDPNEWIKNNGGIDVSSIDIARLDFIMNVVDTEKTEMLWPQGIHDGYVAKLSQIFWKLVQGSGIPEMLWGTKVEGNMASADNQLDMVVKFVDDKRNQKNQSYLRLITDTLKLRNMARLGDQSEIDLSITWNALDMISETAKSTIFKDFAAGIASLINSAGMTKEQTYALWRKMYPEATQEDYDTFVVGLGDMARHKAFAASTYTEIMDLTEEPNLDQPGI